MPTNFTFDAGRARLAGNGVGRWFRQVFFLVARQKSRHRLRDLDRHLLADIGLTAERAEAEATKPFWQD